MTNQRRTSLVLFILFFSFTPRCDIFAQQQANGAESAKQEPRIVGLITSVKDNVTITGSSDKARKAAAYGTIAEGETVNIPPNGLIQIAFPELNTFERKAQPGDWKVGPKGFEERSGIDAKQISGQSNVQKGLARQVKMGSTVARGGKDEQPGVTPIPNSKVHPKDPVTFSWPASEGVTKYRIEFRPQLGGKRVYEIETNKMDFSGDIQRPKYTWSVTAYVSGTATKVVDKRSFEVLRRRDIETADELQKMENSDSPEQIAVAAWAYQDLGLFRRVGSCYEKLIKLTPDAAIPYAELAELYGKMGRAKDSKRMRKAAEERGYSFADKDE